MSQHDQQITVDGEVWNVRYCEPGRNVETLERLWTDPTAGVDMDCETEGLNPGNDKIRLFQVGSEAHCTAWVFPFMDWREQIEGWLWNRQCKMTGQNILFDLLSLSVEYDKLIPTHEVYDTMLLGHQWDGRAPKDYGEGLSLEALMRNWGYPELAEGVKKSMMNMVAERNATNAAEYTDTIARLKAQLEEDKLRVSEENRGKPAALKQKLPLWRDVEKPERPERITKQNIWRKVELTDPTYVLYAGVDVIMPTKLHRKMYRALGNTGIHDLALYDQDRKDMEYAVRIGFNSLGIDRAYFEDLGRRYKSEEQAALEVLKRDFNVDKPNAPAQVVAALQREGMVLTRRTDSGALQADRKVLRECIKDGSKVAPYIKIAKQKNKWQTAYVKNILESEYNGRVFPQIRPLGAATGRNSISNPALQQIPSSIDDVRNGFFVDVSIDYASQEVRAAAVWSQDSVLCGQLQRGDNPMKGLASNVFGQYDKEEYKAIKIIVYASLYGGGVATISDQTGYDEDLVRDTQKAWNSTYVEYKAWSDAETEQAKLLDYVIGWDGRVMPIPRAFDKDTQRWKRLPYVASNRKIQGFGAWLMKKSIRNIMEQTPYGDCILLPVHDELDFRNPPDGNVDKMIETVVPLMEDTIRGIHFPVEVEIMKDGRWKGHGVAHVEEETEE